MVCREPLILYIFLWIINVVHHCQSTSTCSLDLMGTYLLMYSHHTGAGESGKSTIVKQMKILHKDGFSEEWVPPLTKYTCHCACFYCPQTCKLVKVASFRLPNHTFFQHVMLKTGVGLGRRLLDREPLGSRCWHAVFWLICHCVRSVYGRGHTIPMKIYHYEYSRDAACMLFLCAVQSLLWIQ